MSKLDTMCKEYQELFWHYKYISMTSKSYTKKRKALNDCRKHRENCPICSKVIENEDSHD